MNTKLMIEMYRAFRAGAPLGDVALMKFAALRDDHPINKELGDVAGYAPGVDVETLLALPETSFGHAYARFLRDNGLDHLDISPSVLERFRDNPYAVRYTVTHDLHHVLCGFDAGTAGEFGVLGFTVGQGIAPMGPVGTWLGRTLGPLTTPSQARQCRHNYELGLRMGKAAKLLIAAPLESWLDRPIDDVRAELGIDALDVAAARPSGRSWLAQKLYGRRDDAPAHFGAAGAH
ncbi:Coq4 family protein [Enhygromyxa salina]|uniref:Coenzyme Q (Ubiquinone) biosynthesis protein Coq4 n=1 Tax=Enhygromyxa salina TaxID=215803 RepID=A0A2S9YR58_9BACT|nr:Coq4 family protein [Enhygromyxa salina]PRQ07581.1 Coenzyme Q (ubiquinone) biosynthesis protein Coq4 [Enhygromyxa salina]